MVIFMWEGYLVQDHQLIETILQTGHEAGLIVAIDLSSYNIVEQNRDFLQTLISRYVDIVFANEKKPWPIPDSPPWMQ